MRSANISSSLLSARKLYRYGRVSFKRKSRRNDNSVDDAGSVTTSRHGENERFSISQAEDERNIHMYVYVHVCIHMYVLYFSRGSAIA